MGTLPIPVETMLSENASKACGTVTPASETVTSTSGPAIPGVCLCT